MQTKLLEKEMPLKLKEKEFNNDYQDNQVKSNDNFNDLKSAIENTENDINSAQNSKYDNDDYINIAEQQKEGKKIKMLEDFISTFIAVEADEKNKLKDYEKAKNWVLFKSNLLSLNKTSFWGMSMFICSLLIPALFPLGFIGAVILWNTKFNSGSLKNRLFQQNLLEIQEQELKKIPKPQLLTDWLNEFTVGHLNGNKIEIIRDLIEYVPDHPLIVGFSKAFKGAKHGINIKYTHFDVETYLNDGIKTLSQLKGIQTIRNNIKEIKEKNPNLGLPEIEDENIRNYILNSKEDEIIDLEYKQIKPTHDYLFQYLITLQNIGMKALDIE